MKEMQVPGAAIFVQSTATGAWTTGLGVSDVTTREAVTPQQHFRIGSITKTFTSTVILQLVGEGKLRLDDPVAKYQPEVPDGNAITLRELLAMRSGLYNYSDTPEFSQALIAQPERVWTPQELLTIAFKHPPYFAPGKDFHYSNTNFILLGLLIEQITHHPVERELQQRIFTPLGMSHTQLPPRPVATLPTPFAQGYAFDTMLSASAGAQKKLLNVTGWNPSWGWTAGSAISALPDMQIWAQALATGKLLSPAMHKEQITWSSTIAEKVRYSLGIADFAGFIGHNGQIPGYQAFMGYRPETKQTIVVLTNLYAAPDGAGPADTLAKTIQQALSA